MATALVVSVAAQGGGGGGGGFGRQGGMMGGQSNSGLGLLMRNDVQTDLGVTPDQKARLQALSDESRAKRQAMMEEMRNGGGGDFEAMRANMDKMNAEYAKKADEVLTPDQRVRAKEISYQLQGNRAITNADTQKALGFSEAQSAQVKTVMDNFQAANQALMQDMRDGNLDRDSMRAKMDANNKALDAELGKVMTPDQAGKLKAMGGTKPFKADPPPQRPPL
jgi:hypothetical protein